MSVPEANAERGITPEGLREELFTILDFAPSDIPSNSQRIEGGVRHELNQDRMPNRELNEILQGRLGKNLEGSKFTVPGRAFLKYSLKHLFTSGVYDLPGIGRPSAEIIAQARMKLSPEEILRMFSGEGVDQLEFDCFGRHLAFSIGANSFYEMVDEMIGRTRTGESESAILLRAWRKGLSDEYGKDPLGEL